MTIAIFNQFCEAHNLYEYETYHIVTMPDGFQFITRSSELANRMMLEHGASTNYITELNDE